MIGLKKYLFKKIEKIKMTKTTTNAVRKIKFLKLKMLFLNISLQETLEIHLRSIIKLVITILFQQSKMLILMIKI